MITFSIVLYILLQVLIGIWASRRISDQSDFIIAGRSLGMGLATLTIFSTWFGAESIVGVAGEVYDHGLSAAGPDPFGYAFAMILMGLIFARALWSGGFLTLGDLFRREYGPRVERLAVLLILPGPVIWGGAQIRAFGKIMSAVTSIDVTLSITIAAIAVIGYTMLGGLYASALTDCIQGLVIIIGLALLLVCITQSVEPHQLSIPPERLQLFSGSKEGLLTQLESWAVPIFSTFVAVELISRILATRDINVARRATVSGGVLYLFIGLLPLTMGLIAPNILDAPLVDSEQVIPKLAEQFLIFPEWVFPQIIYVILMGAIISAILSTIDSVLLSGASILSHNILVRVFKLEDDRAQMLCTRLCVVGLGVIAYLCALFGHRIKELIEIAASFGSAGLVPVVCFGLFSRLGGEKAAYTALLIGLMGWFMGVMLELTAPYLSSIALSTLGYLWVSVQSRESRTSIRL